MTSGVSFVMPVLNGRRHLRRALRAIRREAAGVPHEIIVIDDGSTDGSERLARTFSARTPGAIVLDGERRGAAAALNAAIRQARYPFICQVDQDVVIESGWLAHLLGAMQDDTVAAAQGRYVVSPRAGFWARMSGRDLDLRYSALASGTTDHVCTGNVIYRASALHQAGLFDERLGYGYDNDMSYRLGALGYRLSFCRDATAVHYWRDSASGYLQHQFGVGYGRLDLVWLHPRRAKGDAVSRLTMMLHAPAMLAAALLAPLALVWQDAGVLAIAMLAALMVERAVAGCRAWRLTGDRWALAFPAAHLARDGAWAIAILRWVWRRVTRRGSRPADSMTRAHDRGRASGGTLLVLIPAYNEAASLPLVVQDVRRYLPAAEILVINDASTDETYALLPTLGVRWLSLPDRLGVGGALRAGVRYALRHGYELVGRMDGDGQHRAVDLRRLEDAVRSGRSDAAAGTRWHGRAPRTARQLTFRLLGWTLTLLTRHRVTDPTCGLWMFGPRALLLLRDHHPGGYPEPELRLLFARHGVSVREVPIRARARHAGRTSVTPRRAAVAFARMALALLVPPVRRVEAPRD